MIDHILQKRIYIHVADRLLRSIAAGEYQIGSYLPPERELALRLGVSRSSVREGLIALEVRGIVEVKVGAGVKVLNSVHEPSQSLADIETLARSVGNPQNVAQELPPSAIFQARRVIEPEAAALACVHATDLQLQGISEAFDQHVREGALPQPAHSGDRLFHIRIAEASGNPVFHNVMQDLLGRESGPILTGLHRVYAEPRQVPRTSDDEHGLILGALQRRKSSEARLAMRTHLDNAIRAMFGTNELGQ